jgi:phosphoenolpyruvate carboxylase
MTTPEHQKMAESSLEQQVENLQNEKKLYFDLAYRSYTELARIADETPDETTRHKILEAIEELGRTIGRAETREKPR